MLSIFNICKLDSMGFFERLQLTSRWFLCLNLQTQSCNIKKFRVSTWKHTSPTFNQGSGLHPNPITSNMPKKGNLSLHLFWNPCFLSRFFFCDSCVTFAALQTFFFFFFLEIFNCNMILTKK